MRRSKRRPWWGLYAVGLVTAALLYGSTRVGGALHKLLLVGIIVVAGLLAWLWSEAHANLMAAEGVNARAEEDSLAAAGIRRGRFAPSLTLTQANYRSSMLSRDTDRAQDAPDQAPSPYVIRHLGDDDAGLKH